MPLDFKNALKQYWGYDSYLPFQKEAMECAGGGRDSLVVLPTGGGKSLCFQAPAVAMPGLTVVVSPLIALMKDQVDALDACGVSAGRLDSSQSAGERNATMMALNKGALKLLYLSPERLMMDGCIEFLKRVNLSMIA
ncbi:DEAD/DEAH box helicase, partial [Candidatus Hydrogenedentota bacterium]